MKKIKISTPASENSIESMVDGFLTASTDRHFKKLKDSDPFKDVSAAGGWISFGVPLLDYSLLTFGAPVGRIVEIAGLSQGGKTTMGLDMMHSFMVKHKSDGFAVILSSEGRDSKFYAEQMGIDTSRVLIIHVKYVEDMFDKFKQFAYHIIDQWEKERRPGQPYFFILWDSIGGSMSRSEFLAEQKNTSRLLSKTKKRNSLTEDSANDRKEANPGAFAKEAKRCIKEFLNFAYTHPVWFIVLNHVQDVIGSPIPNQRKSGGGRWIEFFPSIRLEVTKTESERLDQKVVAQYSRIKVIKNDFAPPAVVEAELLLGHGFVLCQEDIDFAVEEGILRTEKSTYIFNSKCSWRTKREFYQLYWDKNPFMKVLHRKITEARHNQVLSRRKGISVSSEGSQSEDDE